jgi:hypothetical protein
MRLSAFASSIVRLTANRDLDGFRRNAESQRETFLCFGHREGADWSRFRPTWLALGNINGVRHRLPFQFCGINADLFERRIFHGIASALPCVRYVQKRVFGELDQIRMLFLERRHYERRRLGKTQEGLRRNLKDTAIE